MLSIRSIDCRDRRAAGRAFTAGGKTCSRFSSTRPLGKELVAEAFAPGFFVWNSEVRSASVGISTFWLQQVCRNHIVWDATEVVEFARKHPGKVGEALSDIRRIVERLVTKRDAHRDGFAAVIKKAMEQTLGEDAEEAMKALTRNGIPRGVARKAVSTATRANPARPCPATRWGRLPRPGSRLAHAIWLNSFPPC